MAKMSLRTNPLSAPEGQSPVGVSPLGSHLSGFGLTTVQFASEASRSALVSSLPSWMTYVQVKHTATLQFNKYRIAYHLNICLIPFWKEGGFFQKLNGGGVGWGCGSCSVTEHSLCKHEALDSSLTTVREEKDTALSQACTARCECLRQTHIFRSYDSISTVFPPIFIVNIVFVF